MHPYALGALIADGYFGRKNHIEFSSQSGETVDLLRQYLPATASIKDCRGYGNNSWLVQSFEWVSALKELGLWGKRSVDKFIPGDYLFASVQDRILLLQGLMDCDGNSGLLRYTTCSPQLAEDVAHLIRSLGGIAKINHSKERLHQNGKTINKSQYGINYWVPDDIEPNQLVRKRIGRKTRAKGTHRRGIKEVRKTDRVADMRCIAVDAPDCLYVTKDFVVTHNTTTQIRDGDDVFMDLDDQVGSYPWALRWELGLPVRGFVYHQQRKSFPEPPRQNKARRMGRLFSVDKSQSTDYNTYWNTVREQDQEAWIDGLYDEYIEFLKAEGPGFFDRRVIFKSDEELISIGENISYEAAEMVNPNLPKYPNPGRFHCKTCAFRQPCMEKNRKGDYRYALATLFERKPHYWLRQPSTETKGAE